MKRLAAVFLLVAAPAMAQRTPPPDLGAQQPTPSQAMVGQLGQALAIQSDAAAQLQKRVTDLMGQIAALTKERDELKAKAPVEGK